MKKQGNNIVYVIAFIVLVTIGIQFYWNFTQYNINKNQVVNEVQTSLDNALDTYYTELSKKSIEDLMKELPIKANNISDKNVKIETKAKIITSTPDIDVVESSMLPDYFIDSLKKHSDNKYTQTITIKSDGSALNDINNDLLGEHISKVLISAKNDTVDLNLINSHFNNELKRKNLNLKYSIISKDKNDIILRQIGNFDESFKLSAKSNSLLLPNNVIIEVKYPDVFWIVLNKGLTGLILSSILSGVIIFILFYLLRVINKQKQISEIKNDFISNITHELKTPIATVSTAVEAMQHFNTENDPSRNQKYLDISGQQLDKLKILVDKIMETSILETSELQLTKEFTDLVKLLKKCIYKLQFSTQKNIIFNSNTEEIFFNVDLFHFENAVSNLIENAVKYGGEIINVDIQQNDNKINICISDNGVGIPKEHQKLLFDKFYRVPSNNKHNVKGFGIGLYYTKNIIEKHQGIIDLTSEVGATTFKIELWEK